MAGDLNHAASGELSRRNLLASSHREPRGNGCAMSKAPQRAAKIFWLALGWAPSAHN
jgi:hypothetical protein